MRALATGDSHIGAGRDLASDRLDEQEGIWRETLALSRSEQVDVVLHGGDLWEHRKPDPACYLAAERPLVEHRDLGGPPVLMIAGNHCRSGVDDNLALSVLAQAGLIQLWTEPGKIDVWGTAVCFLPWTPVSRLVAQQDGGDRDAVFQDAAELLIQTAADLRKSVDGPAVLLLHWSIDAADLPSGLPVAMLREVVLPLDALEGLGFDAIIAAHIHKPQLLTSELGGGPTLYAGSPLPLSFGEPGEHGIWLLDSDTWRPRFVPLQSRTFHTINLSESGRDVITLPGAFVKVRGPSGLDRDAIEGSLLAAGAQRVWFDLTADRPARTRVEGLDEATGPLDALEQYLTSVGVNGQVGAALLARAGGYLERTRA